MKYFQIIISIFGFLWMSQYGYAQDTQVTGTVVDDYGPVIGASVMVQGTRYGTVTDMDGRFTLKDVKNADKAVLIVRYVGMKQSKEALKGRRSNIVVQMIEDTNHLDDVVVIGYGTQKRGNLTGAISTVSGAELEKVPTASVAEALVGRLPGVQVTAADGSPDADVTILVRGGGSITQDNTPLILVDGFEVSNLKDIPPTDVESIDVLKDAASTAIYGARGANGVILVTTKKPNEGRISINLNAYLQTKTLSNKLDVMDPYEYVMMQYENSRNKSLGNQNGVLGNRFGQTYEFYIYQGDEGTDWQDEIFGTNPTSQYYDLNVNGGTGKMKRRVFECFTYNHI